MLDRLIRKCFVCLSLAVCSSPIGAGTWFFDNFDTYSNGALSGQGGWTGNASVLQIVQSYEGSTKVIKGDCLTWGDGEGGLSQYDVSHAVSSGSGYHYIDFDAAMDVDGDTYGSNLGYVKIFGPTGNEVTRFYYAWQQFKVLLGGPQQYVVLDNVQDRTWYHIRIGINTTTSKMDVWINGVQRLSGGNTYTSASSIASIAIGQWDRYDFTRTETYLDNLSCSTDDQNSPGELILTPYSTWDRNHVTYPFVMQDGTQYRMFYSASGGPELSEAAWSQWVIGMVTSSDTRSWVRRTDIYEPALYARKYMEGDLIDPEESAAIFDSIWAIGACVIKDGSTYKMWYTGWGGETEHIGGGLENKINFRIGYATSTDATNWTKHPGTAGAGSVLGLGSAGQPDCKGAGQPFVLKEGSTYRMWYEAFDGSVWRIMYATSTDGTNWTKQGVAIPPGPAGSFDSLGARNPVVIIRGGKYELWYQGESSGATRFHILRAQSADGITWTKLPGEVQLEPPAPAGDPAWNPMDPTARISVDSIIVNSDQSCSVFYSKEMTRFISRTYGNVEERKYYIYREEVNP